MRLDDPLLLREFDRTVLREFEARLEVAELLGRGQLTIADVGVGVLRRIVVLIARCLRAEAALL